MNEENHYCPPIPDMSNTSGLGNRILFVSNQLDMVLYNFIRAPSAGNKHFNCLSQIMQCSFLFQSLTFLDQKLFATRSEF